MTEQGFRVLLTCFNVNLAEFLGSDETLPRRLEVANFHKLAQGLVRKAGLAHSGLRSDHYFDHVLPELMMEATERLGAQYDAIIVDEGQDFYDSGSSRLQQIGNQPGGDRDTGGIFFIRTSKGKVRDDWELPPKKRASPGSITSVIILLLPRPAAPPSS